MLPYSVVGEGERWLRSFYPSLVASFPVYSDVHRTHSNDAEKKCSTKRQEKTFICISFRIIQLRRCNNMMCIPIANIEVHLLPRKITNRKNAVVLLLLLFDEKRTKFCVVLYWRSLSLIRVNSSIAFYCNALKGLFHLFMRALRQRKSRRKSETAAERRNSEEWEATVFVGHCVIYIR